jgi:hypothetical protein
MHVLGMHVLQLATACHEPHLPHPMRAGPPAASKTMFCDPATALCFNLTTSLRSFAAASAACSAMSGQLVQYRNADKQLLVEMVRACC